MSSRDADAFQGSLLEKEIPIDPSFSSQLYSTIHYLYPTATTNKEKQSKPVEPTLIEKALPGLALRNTEPVALISKEELSLFFSLIPSKSERRRSRSPSHHRSHHHHHSRYSRSRSRSRSHSHSRSHHHSHQSRSLEVNEIYDGRVRSIMDYGVFIELCDVYPRKEGLCHISNICQSRIRHPSDIVHRDELVKVKVTQITGSKVSLSMKDVNQQTGEPIRQGVIHSTGYNEERAPLPPVRRKRLSSYERFELEQMISSGVLSPEEQKELLSQYDNVGMNDTMQTEEAIDIEVNHAPAPFIKDASFKNVSMEPTKIVKNPEGSLARAALTGSSMVQERKMLRERQAKEQRDKLPDVVSYIWFYV